MAGEQHQRDEYITGIHAEEVTTMKITIKMDGQQVYFTADGKEYRTNPAGEGLWAWRQASTYDLHDHKYVHEWQQIEGTCQFSLRQQTRGGMRKAIERYFREGWEE